MQADRTMRYIWLLAFVFAPALWLPLFGPALASMLPQDTQEEAVEEEPPPPLAIPPGYRYDPSGRRDPFVNPVPPPVEDTRPVIPVQRPPGLPGVLLNEAQLIGVVTSPVPSMNVVVVLAPGNRTFFARAGDELFDAVIKEIDPNAIVFEVKPLEGQPEPDRREEVVRRLSTTPGE